MLCKIRILNLNKYFQNLYYLQRETDVSFIYPPESIRNPEVF